MRQDRLLKSKALKNGVWMYLLQFFNAVVPLLTLPYITRILGTIHFGNFSIALNIVTYLQVLVEYGFGMSATRKVAVNNTDNINRLFTAVFGSRLLLLLISLIIVLPYLFINKNTEIRLCIIVLMTCLIGYCFQTNWIFQGLEEMQFISIFSIISRVISVIAIFVFVNSASDVLLYSFLFSVAPLLSGIIGFSTVIIKFGIRLTRIGYKDILSELKDGFYVFTTQMSSKVFSAIGITFLGLFATSAEVGVYSAIQKITNIMILAWTPIAQVLYPISSKHLCNDYQQGKRYILSIRNKVVPVFIVLAIMVGLFSKKIISLAFGQEYLIFWYWIIPLLIWLVLAINNNFLGIQILLGSNHDKEYSSSFQIGVLVTVVLNFILILLFKGNGASIAPALSELFLAFMLSKKIRDI